MTESDNARTKRTTADLLASILHAGVRGTMKTELMYRAYMNYAQVQKYLTIALEAELIERLSKNKYRTTNKGHRFLEVFEELKKSETKIKEHRKMLREFLGRKEGSPAMVDSHSKLDGL